MPQNVVVGQDAINVAEFVSTYAGTPGARGSRLTPASSKRSARSRQQLNRDGHRDQTGGGSVDHDGSVHEREIGGGRASGPRQGQGQGRKSKTSARRRAILDIRLIRRDPDAVRAALSRRGPDAAAAVDRVLELDERWRALTTELEQLARRAEPGQPRPQGAAERRPSASSSPRWPRAAASSAMRSPRLRAERDAALAALPNLPARDAPAEDTVLREVGEAGADRARPPGARGAR